MKVAQSCPTLCNPMDCSLAGSSVNGILQATILQWVAVPFFRGSSWPRDQTQVSSIAGRFFTVWATREVQRQRNQRSNCQHPLDNRKSRKIPEKNIYFCFIDYAKAFDCVDHNKLWKILQEMGIPDHLPHLSPEKPVYKSRSNCYNWTWNNELVPNWERSTSRL